MKILKTLLAFVLVASVQSCAGAPAYGQQSNASVVTVRSETGKGTGTYIGNGRILTAAHVVGDATILTIIAEDGTEYSATVLVNAAPYDVAVLTLLQPTTLPEAPIACRTPAVGEHVEGIGHPLSFSYVHSFGRVSSDMRSTRPLMMQFLESIFVTLPIGPGMSGGPVFATDGGIVGIMVAGLIDSDFGAIGINVVVPGSTICNVINVPVS